jgi:YHS domain-containing protein
MPTQLRVSLIALIVVVASGCSTRNTISDGDDDALMLRGNDPVAYHTVGNAVKGNPAIKAEHDGLSYRFASEENRRTFIADPQRYVPAYGGYCASGAPYALKARIGANTFKIIDGRLYLFGSPRSRRNWELDQAENIRVGDWYWENETKDRPDRLQNWYRYTFKVAHYKTDAQLDAEWQRRYGKQ